MALAQKPPRPPAPGGPPNPPVGPGGPPLPGPVPGEPGPGLAPPPPPGGPVANGQPAAGGTDAQNNPWHELLHRMMELMQTAAGMEAGPGGPGPDPNAGPGPQGGPGGPGPMGPGNLGPNPEYQVGPGGPSGPNRPMPLVGPGGPQGPGPMGRGPSGPPKPPNNPAPTAPSVPDCFWEGKFYRPGSDIVRGQHDRWCYVTYCDSKGNIQFWDDYNCPPNSMKPTSGHNTGRPSPQAQGPTGCNYNNINYEPGQEISSQQVGDRCHGTYCSHDSQVIQWEDWCATQPPQSPNQPPAGPNPTPPTGPGPAAPPTGPIATQPPVQGPPSPSVPLPQPQPPAQFTGTQSAGGAGAGAGAGGGRKGGRRGPKQGCFHNQLYYQPNEDVIVGNIGDMCYGYYCEGDNVFVHWEDRCANANVGAGGAAGASGGAAGMNTGMGANTGAAGSFWI